MATVPRTRDLTIEEALGLARVGRILGVHPRAVERCRAAARKTPKHAVRPFEIQREEKLHRIWRDLTKLFTPENAIVWLEHPAPALEGRTPVDVMTEDGGLARVLETVGRMSWGIPA